MGSKEKFVRPKEALTFYPTEEEFSDPLAYIRKIRPIAENYGICKIRPPNHWAPPFSVNPNKFKFTPRIQKLNELDAISRIKLNFKDRISKFWALQGFRLDEPVAGLKPLDLDLYSLHQFVHSKDFEKADLTETKKWKNVAKRLGFPVTKNIGNNLKTLYATIILPYDEWRAKFEEKTESSAMPECPSTKKPKRGRKRQMGGRGVIVTDQGSKTESKEDGTEISSPNAQPQVKLVDIQGCYNCKQTNQTEEEEGHSSSVVICTGCNRRCHLSCLYPVLNQAPSVGWHCPPCISEKLRPPQGLEFGFDQAEKEYTLQQFGEMADKFKSDYFNQPACRVPLETVEKEFWRIVSAINEKVIVEYGADLDTYDGNSSPPTSAAYPKIPEGKSPHNWNFGVLPTLTGSAFGHFNSKISGMTTPWTYVGMCFSTFCWHNEDHWSYSISYLHRGEPKTWYGVPGKRAEDFEDAMKSAAPELFAQTPDLLHQLVTIMNPSVLKKAKVPVYRMDQKQGEFIVTFPRAYHAGFNQGYNFAEAVNFAPADWVSIGRECVLHYSQVNRPCVFSHDELMCAMASQPEKLDWLIASTAYKDMVKMVKYEKEQRVAAYKTGVRGLEHVMFEQIPDDDRQCSVCKTTVYLSAVSCVHQKLSSSPKLVCLKHHQQLGCELCQESPHGLILKFRHTIDDFAPLMLRLKKKAEKYNRWSSALLKTLKLENSPNTARESELTKLLNEASESSFPRTALLERAEASLTEMRRLTVTVSRKRSVSDSGVSSSSTSSRSNSNSDSDSKDEEEEIDERPQLKRKIVSC